MQFNYSKNNRRGKSLFRMLCAATLIVLLLLVTWFAPIKMLLGPTVVKTIEGCQSGDFVKRDIYSILGYYGEESSSGRTTGRYAVVPMDGRMVSVHFTARYLETADAVVASTYSVINGEASALNDYCTVEGTVRLLQGEASGLMYDWFTANYDQMIDMSIIAPTNDYAQYISDYVLEVDVIGRQSIGAVTAECILIGALLLYIIIEGILQLSGFYAKKDGESADWEDKI